MIRRPPRSTLFPSRRSSDLPLEIGLLEDVPDALEGNREWLEILGFANDLQCPQSFMGINQIVHTRAENRVHFVVAEFLPFAKHKLCAIHQDLQHLRLLLGLYAF